MRTLLRRNHKFFGLTALAGLLLRVLFLLCCARVTNDSHLYADIAKNWLYHGIYGITDNGVIVTTLTRLPGYPAFLAAMFAVFRPDRFAPVFIVQILADLATCFVVADIARRIFSDRSAKAAFLLAALCPFLANYAAVALTETLEVFFTALALDCAIAALGGLGVPPGTNPDRIAGVLAGQFSLGAWIGCGAAIAAAILLRPDGGILLAAVGVYLGFILVKGWKRQRRWAIAKAGLVVTLTAIAPLVPWALRNWHTFHHFQPLAPRYANEQDEQVPYGFNRWVRTWMADYASVEEIYWPVPDEEVDPARLPNRAFDSLEQRQATLDALSAYNEERAVSPELDARFAAVAAERIQAHPLRYYVGLPFVRIADMWLRPRTELLGADVRWWEFNEDPQWSVLAVGFGVINLFYVGAALAGTTRFRAIRYVGLLACFVVLRSLFLGTLENPEPRYTLECYPVVIALAAIGLAGCA